MGWRAGLFSALASCALTIACTSKAHCYPYNCAGCCDANDTCQPSGDLATACGYDGKTCAVCGRGQTCTSGACTGELIGDGGAVTCSAANCGGCCDANGACVAGTSSGACGIHQARCAVCGTNQICSSAGQCEAGACLGCLGDAGCSPGISNVSCGSGGAACKVCPVGQSCFNKACVSAVTCGPANCSGCCEGTTCQNSSATSCGSNGVTCVTCASGTTCNSGMCGMPGTGGGGTQGPCNQLTCLRGCCDGDNRCRDGNDNDACGIGGTRCNSCAFVCFLRKCY